MDNVWLRENDPMAWMSSLPGPQKSYVMLVKSFKPQFTVVTHCVLLICYFSVPKSVLHKGCTKEVYECPTLSISIDVNSVSRSRDLNEWIALA